MLRKIEITNYKSISKLPIELGRFNVVIGENGAGKSNILEAIALAGAAASDKLDNEYLAARGVRVTRPELMRAAFAPGMHRDPISVQVTHEHEKALEFELQNDNEPYSRWHSSFRQEPSEDSELARVAFREWVKRELPTMSLRVQDGFVNAPPGSNFEDAVLGLVQAAQFKSSQAVASLKDFLIYSPENTALRAFEREGQIEPLGINGEGLLKLIHVHASITDGGVVARIKEALKILGWFEDFSPSDSIADERLIIKDRYLENVAFALDQKSANEGFLFLLFYFALFTSKLTPKFFAVDNIDASLNPKLCQKLTIELVKLSKANDKQVIVTTHNPGILDGLNLDDDEQRLFVVSRGRDGATKLKRIRKPASDGPAYRLSELFLRGLLGGLPKGF